MLCSGRQLFMEWIPILKYSQKRLKIFLANRVQQITETSDVMQWHPVPSKMNPADFFSLGLPGSNKKKINCLEVGRISSKIGVHYIWLGEN